MQYLSTCSIWGQNASKQKHLVQGGPAPFNASPVPFARFIWNPSAEEKTSNTPFPGKSVLASAPSPAAPCPGWLLSPLYLNGIAVTPHWGQRVGSGLVGKIPTASKHWSGGHQLPCTRGCIQPGCSGHEQKSFLQCQGCARLCSQSQGSQCTTDLTQQQQQPRLLSVG